MTGPSESDSDPSTQEVRPCLGRASVAAIIIQVAAITSQVTAAAGGRAGHLAGGGLGPGRSGDSRACGGRIYPRNSILNRPRADGLGRASVSVWQAGPTAGLRLIRVRPSLKLSWPGFSGAIIIQVAAVTSRVTAAPAAATGRRRPRPGTQSGLGAFAGPGAGPGLPRHLPEEFRVDPQLEPAPGRWARSPPDSAMSRAKVSGSARSPGTVALAP